MDNSGFRSQLMTQRGTIIPIIVLLGVSSMIIGVQRIFLSIYTSSLDTLFTGLVTGAAISLASYGLLKAIGNFTGGLLSSKRSRKYAQVLGVVVLLIGSIILAFTSSIIIFFVGNSLVGLGIGLIYASSTIALTDIIQPQDRAKSISLMELCVYLGTSIGAFMAGVITTTEPVKAFVFALVLALLNLGTIKILKDTGGSMVKVEDIHHSSVSEKLHEITSLPGISEEIEDVIFAPINERILNELQESTPIRLARRFLSPSLLIIFSTGIITRIADSVVIIVLPLLLLSYDYSIFQVAIITSLFTIFWAVGISLSGTISDNVGRKRPLVIGEFLEAVGYMIIFFLGLKTWFPIMILGIMVSGLGRGLYFPITPSVATEFVSPDQRAKTIGIYRFILDSGYVVGAGLVIVLIDIRPTDNFDNQFEPIFNLLISILILLGILSIFYLKESKPGFKQLPTVSEHLDIISRSILHSEKSIELLLQDPEESMKSLLAAKVAEQEADAVLEKLTKNTYQHVWKTSYDFELLQFSAKADKVAGHAIRGIRKLHAINEQLPLSIIKPLEYYGRILVLLVNSSVETVSLMRIRIDLAAEYSYTVSAMEEVLDNLHKYLWHTITEEAGHIKPLNLILITQAIDSLEKGANTMEDAVEIIRLLAFKHQIYQN